MNQILQVQEDRKKSNSNPIDTKKIVLFFAVCLIIFGTILLGEGAYSAYKNKSNRKVIPSTPSRKWKYTSTRIYCTNHKFYENR